MSIDAVEEAEFGEDEYGDVHGPKRRPAMTSSEACKRQSSRTLFTLPLSKRKVRLRIKGCLFNSAQLRRGVGGKKRKDNA